MVTYSLHQHNKVSDLFYKCQKELENIQENLLHLSENSAWAVFGQCATPHLLLLFLGGFGNSFRAVFGQFSLIFGSFRVVFGQKKTDGTAQSVIVNC